MPTRTAASQVEKAPSKWGVALLLIIVVLLVRAIRPTSSEPVSIVAPQQPVTSASDDRPPSSAPKTNSPRAVPLEATVRQAAEDARRAVGALGASGAKLYSENCYAALTSDASGTARDRCLAFDQLAARMLNDAGDASEGAWFGDYAVRERYIRAPGMDASTADAAIARVAAATVALNPAASAANAPDTEPDAMETEEDAAPTPPQDEAIDAPAAIDDVPDREPDASATTSPTLDPTT